MYTEHIMSTIPTPESPNAPTPVTQAESKPRKVIPLIAIPNDQDMIEAEMAELFDEDRVSHQHGSSEPEAD